MTFNPNIPQGNQPIRTTQSPIQNNFSISNTAFAIDHTAFDVASNQGMHKQVTFQNVLSGNPGKVSPIASLYTKVSTSTSTSDLFYQNGTLAANVVQLTGGGITAAAWITFIANSALPYSPAAGTFYNITNITNGGTGKYQLNFTRSFINTNYVVYACLDGASPLTVSTRNVNSVIINPSATAQIVNILIFGILT